MVLRNPLKRYILPPLHQNKNLSEMARKKGSTGAVIISPEQKAKL
jgi:hypothetical protein